jgi:hypothetical protein
MKTIIHYIENLLRKIKEKIKLNEINKQIDFVDKVYSDINLLLDSYLKEEGISFSRYNLIEALHHIKCKLEEKKCALEKQSN